MDRSHGCLSHLVLRVFLGLRCCRGWSVWRTSTGQVDSRPCRLRSCWGTDDDTPRGRDTSQGIVEDAIPDDTPAVQTKGPPRWLATWSAPPFSLGQLLLVAVVSLIVLLAAFFASESNYENVKEIAPIVFTPLATLLGTAVAWYYAGETKEKKEWPPLGFNPPVWAPK